MLSDVSLSIDNPRQKTISGFSLWGVVVSMRPKGQFRMHSGDEKLKPTMAVAAVSLAALYFLAAYWFKQDDPILISPKVDGKIVHLRGPFIIHSKFGAAAPDYWFGAVADSESDLCRSPVHIYENDQRLWPLHTDRVEVGIKGMGRAVHWRSDDSPALYGELSVFMLSSSDNSDPNTNGRSYWAVVPKLDAITCGDSEPDRSLEFPGELMSGGRPKVAVRLKHFEVSPTSSLVVSHEIQQLEEVADTPDDEKRSPVLLYENDRLLGPAHSIHDDIAKIGLGRYSHWEKGMVFSTSDNSNPSTNGRSYWVVLPKGVVERE
jgi:hypothetical protein